ncbi:MAG: hypothetical protein HY080_08085 [Gammaproteobacteria bacterium]|nr:hypothetical protein [Gammaproteobacteria bacterium]
MTAKFARRFPRYIVATVMVVVMGILPGCGGGGGSVSTGPANADPTGYYDITGTASVKQTNNTTPLIMTELQGMVYNGRLIMLSKSAGYSYDGMIAVTGNNYTGTLTVYQKGINPLSAPVSGTITPGATITGTLTGTGAGNGTFTLKYAANNNQPAALSTVGRVSPALWTGKISEGNINTDFTIDSTTGSMSSFGGSKPTFLCDVDGTLSTVTPISGTHLYSVKATVINCFNSASTGPNGTYTGLATTRTTTNLDDTLVMVMTNGAYSMDGELQ